MAGCREGAPIIRLVGADLQGDCQSPILRNRRLNGYDCRGLLHKRIVCFEIIAHRRCGTPIFGSFFFESLSAIAGEAKIEIAIAISTVFQARSKRGVIFSRPLVLEGQFAPGSHSVPESCTAANHLIVDASGLVIYFIYSLWT